MRETWYGRELPVLTAVVNAFEHGLADGFPDVPDIVEATGLSADDVSRSLSALDGQYLVFVQTMSGDGFVEKIFPAARRAVGQWPSPEDLVGRMASALREVADRTEDPTTKGRLRQAAEAIGGLAQKVLVEVGAKLIEHQAGLG